MKSLLSRIVRPVPASDPENTRRRRLRIDDMPFPIYAIGDVHGCYDELIDAERRVLADLGSPDREATLIYLGDYVDRGPNSKAVLDHLARRNHGDGLTRIALCGNHDDAFLSFINDPANTMYWLDFGGDATLRSYGIEPYQYFGRSGGLTELKLRMKEVIPQEHVNFLQYLPIALQVRSVVFVHAGVRPGVPMERQSDEDLIWIREPFLTEGPRLPLVVIHGHTASQEPVFDERRICIDTCCYATGRLAVLRLGPHGAHIL
ncbi:serine/threonine protein phosphatase [Sinorhizobium sp. BG8]|nr:serine/threonine protein phosphatase [Sinorhizobium sp. BG8]